MVACVLLMKWGSLACQQSFIIITAMSKDVQADANSRNRSKSDNPKEASTLSRPSKNAFKVTGQMILDNHFSNRSNEIGFDSEANSLQNMKSSTMASKLTKITDFVQLPILNFQETKRPPPLIFHSQEVLPANSTPAKPGNNSIPSILVEEEQNSVIMQSHQKLSESRRIGEENSWNIQRLQMALDYVELEQAESPTPDRNPTKRKMRRQKQKQIEKERERVRRERERNMEMVSGFLSGKATFMWLFILGKTINDEDIAPVRQIYKTYLDNDYQIPICKDYNQALRFLKIQSCFFKVVSDLNNSQLLISQNNHNQNIIAIYLYNPDKEKGVSRAFEAKRSSRKVRGMFMDLADAAQLAEEEIENEAKFIRVGQNLERQRNRLRFPSFFILNGVDSTEVTSYRMCLYGSLCLKEEKEREAYLKEFTDMVELRYSNNEGELRNLAEYKTIDHVSPPDQSKHRQIMGFYVRQTFYYALLNAMLRLSRNAEQFRPCVIPFNQTYLAIKHFYKQNLANLQKGSKFSTFRGAKLRRSDVKSLQVGSLIELLGFTSTSFKKEQAQKFMDNDSYLIEIVVQTTAANEEELDYDHGFIDINRNKLAASAFEEEEEILFNALNVYRVIGLDLQSAVRKITLSYGAVVDLIRSKKQLKSNECSVLENYRHCVSSFKLIQDDGDALRLAQEHDQCVSYYQTKIQNGQGDAKSFGKLAGAQLEVGDIDAAYENAIRSLSMIEQQAKATALSQAYRVPLELNSRVFDQSEDVVNYQKATNLYLPLLSWEEKCKILLERAEKKLEMGNYKGSILDIKLSQQTLKNQEESFDRRRSELKRKYFFTGLCCLCSSKQMEMEQAKEIELLKIEEDEILFQSKRSLTIQLQMQMEVVMKNVCLKIGDDYQYQESLKRAHEHFKMLQGNPVGAFQEAKYQVMQANTLDLKHEFVQYEQFMEEAIENVRLENPLHPDIANYSEMLGLKRYQVIQQNLNIPKDSHTDIPARLWKFDYDDHKLMYKKCRGALLEAADNLAFHKGQTHRRTLSVNNQLATLDYDFSLLKQAEDKIRPTAKLQVEGSSEGAKCHILLAKIALAKGELKRASSHIDKATTIIKNSLIKTDDPQYNRIVMQHPLYLETSILRAKVFNRQQKHQLALKELQMLQRLVKLQKPYNVALLANLQEEEAQILVCLGQTRNFESCVLRSVQLREQAMGRFNIPNAISFSNLFKYLRFTNDFENSVKYHQKSTQIFSRFPPDHPNAWVMHLSNGLIFFQRKQFQLALPQLEIGLRIAERRYSPSHINFMKIKLQFAKLLKGMGYLQRALNILQGLEAIISKNIRESALAERIEHETDDQKITVRRSILTEMKELYERSKNEKNIVRTMLGLERCQVNLRQCEEFISDSEKIDSLKSLN